MKPGITLAMIVRNEEEKLGRCLDSVKGHVDKIAIVDTGSTDRTIEIANSFGARVSQIEWPDAFDVARNSSLDLVETEWVLWLDADEWLDPASAPALKEAARNERAFAYFIARYDLHHNDTASGNLQLRMWRHDPSLRFRGVIHEHIPIEDMHRAFPDKVILSTNLGFWHDGYDPILTRAKALRNLPLLRRAIQDLPEILYYDIELAQTLKALGDSEGKEVEERLADRVLTHATEEIAPENTVSVFLMRYLADLPDSQLRSERTETFLRLGRGWFTDHPGVRSLCAQTEIRRGELRAALQDLLAVEEMSETGVYDRFTSTNPKMLGEALSLNLALVAHQLGREDIALKHYLRLLQLVPNHPVAVQNMKLLTKDQVR